MTLSINSPAARTQICNPNPFPPFNEIIVQPLSPTVQPAPPSALEELRLALADPASHKTFLDQLGDPVAVSEPYLLGGIIYWSISYPVVQDPDEVVKLVRTHPTFGPRLGWVGRNFQLCGVPPQPPVQTVTEYFNSTLGHYFLSNTSEENAFIDSGGAGSGWERTGQSFRTFAPAYCLGMAATYRFYGTPGIGPNSHFFTSSPEECGLLRRGVGWMFEGISFGAVLPSNGACLEPRFRPVYRFYNDRWRQNDSNHRYATSSAIRAEMVTKGWIDEGVTLCIPTTAGNP